MELTQDTVTLALAFLFALSELLAVTPIKSNSVFQLFAAIIKKLAGK